jgi:hypothetical protein
MLKWEWSKLEVSSEIILRLHGFPVKEMRP